MYIVRAERLGEARCTAHLRKLRDGDGWRWTLSGTTIREVAADSSPPSGFSRPDADINVVMLLDWHDILPAAIRSLTPLHQEIITHLMNRPGKQRPSCTYAAKNWGIDRDTFEVELQSAFLALRQYMKRYGLTGLSDLALR